MPIAKNNDYLDRPYARRQWIAQAAAGLLGVHCLPTLEQLAFATAPAAPGKQVIMLTMRGAMSHLDTFDPKPGRESLGETKTIQTKTPGVLFGSHLPKLASMSEDLAVIRSMTTETGDHEQGTYFLRTGYKKINSIQHPAMGAWLLNAMGKISRTLPGNVLIGNGNDHPNAGFLDPKMLPVPIADPAKGIENIKSPAYLSEENFKRRLTLAGKIDTDFRKKYGGAEMEAYNELYREAVRLMGSTELIAFDINKENFLKCVNRSKLDK
ncbi:MAG: DUF1501 domain-containing protein [Pirellula sp.]|nr:DUF1501 domain-containing protein [Pirellula sp.]